MITAALYALFRSCDGHHHGLMSLHRSPLTAMAAAEKQVGHSMTFELQATGQWRVLDPIGCLWTVVPTPVED